MASKMAANTKTSIRHLLLIVKDSDVYSMVLGVNELQFIRTNEEPFNRWLINTGKVIRYKYQNVFDGGVQRVAIA